MTTFEKYKEIIRESNKYPTISELIYKYGFTKNEIENVNQYKVSDPNYIKLDLFDQVGNPLLYWNDDKIIMNFLGSQELIRNSNMNQFFDYNDSEIYNGFIFSEIKSSLLIEGVRSTRAQIEKLNKLEYDIVIQPNDIIVKNMLMGYEFVRNNPITEENIFKLYNILSKNSLSEHEKLRPGNYYRHDNVDIVDGRQVVVDKGVKYETLNSLMKQLITFINKEKTFEQHLIASHIIHYYIAYLHPYFDYNGRIARVMSFWYNLENAPSLSLLLVNEAINNKLHKKDYYNAIMNSRKSDNDLSYFLEYMGDIILKYTKVYINFYNILKKLKEQGVIVNRSNEIALKNVLSVSSHDKYFDWKDYRDYTVDDFSKQYYLKLLNKLVELEILSTKEYKKTKLFKLNASKWDLI